MHFLLAHTVFINHKRISHTSFIERKYTTVLNSRQQFILNFIRDNEKDCSLLHMFHVLWFTSDFFLILISNYSIWIVLIFSVFIFSTEQLVPSDKFFYSVFFFIFTLVDVAIQHCSLQVISMDWKEKLASVWVCGRIKWKILLPLKANNPNWFRNFLGQSTIC